jgi:hypothetical protein
MESQDEYYYVVEDDFIAYFKNGKLHRKAGPAVYHIKLKEKYFNLKDKDLYNLKVLKSTPDNVIIFHMLAKYHKEPEGVTTFYLEDIEYIEKDFYTLMDREQLEKELNTNQSTIKKLKI